jgi:hypothetical protein
MEIWRGKPRQFRLEPGAERGVFLAEAAVVLEADPAQLDGGTTLTEEYGVDELEIFELVQIAEDIWRVRLNPNPMSAADFATMKGRFPTLDSIIDAARSASSLADA